MKLLIRNLDRTTTAETLEKLFQAVGKVQSCTIVMDKETGESKGFGFVEMPKPGEANAAIKTLNGKQVDQEKIRVKKAENAPAEPKIRKQRHANDPMHGMTLEKILNKLVDEHGFEKLGKAIKINCFTTDPTVESSLTFLRRTKWARKEVEEFYLEQLEAVAPRENIWNKKPKKK